MLTQCLSDQAWGWGDRNHASVGPRVPLQPPASWDPLCTPAAHACPHLGTSALPPNPTPSSWYFRGNNCHQKGAPTAPPARALCPSPAIRIKQGGGRLTGTTLPPPCRPWPSSGCSPSPPPPRAMTPPSPASSHCAHSHLKQDREKARHWRQTQTVIKQADGHRRGRPTC